MRFHHVGVACGNIEEALAFIEKTRTVVRRTDIVYDRAQNVAACMVTVKGGPDIELLSGPAVEAMARKGVALYHLCYEVDDFDAVLRRFTDSGALSVTSPAPAVFFGNRRFAFVHTPLGITEFIEAAPK